MKIFQWGFLCQILVVSLYSKKQSQMIRTLTELKQYISEKTSQVISEYKHGHSCVRVRLNMESLLEILENGKSDKDIVIVYNPLSNYHPSDDENPELLSFQQIREEDDDELNINFFDFYFKMGTILSTPIIRREILTLMIVESTMNQLLIDYGKVYITLNQSTSNFFLDDGYCTEDSLTLIHHNNVGDNDIVLYNDDLSEETKYMLRDSWSDYNQIREEIFKTITFVDFRSGLIKS